MHRQEIEAYIARRNYECMYDPTITFDVRDREGTSLPIARELDTFVRSFRYPSGEHLFRSLGDNWVRTNERDCLALLDRILISNATWNLDSDEKDLANAVIDSFLNLIPPPRSLFSNGCLGDSVWSVWSPLHIRDLDGDDTGIIAVTSNKIGMFWSFDDVERSTSMG